MTIHLTKEKSEILLQLTQIMVRHYGLDIIKYQHSSKPSTLAVMLGLPANLKLLCIERTFFDCSMLTFEFVSEGRKEFIHKLV